MNLNDIKPGRELDALVAEKVMGLNVKPVFHAKSTEPLVLKPGAFYQMVDGWSIPYIPDYSTSIADAWLVVEKVYDFYTSEPLVLRIYGPLSDGYAVTIVWEHHDGPIEEETFVAPTAPHAICLAALKSVGYVPCEKD